MEEIPQRSLVMSQMGQNENPPLAVTCLLSPDADITRTNQLHVDWSTGEVIRCPGDVSAGGKGNQLLSAFKRAK